MNFFGSRRHAKLKDYLSCRVVVLGDSGVGKSSLIKRFVRRQHIEENLNAQTSPAVVHKVNINAKDKELCLNIFEFGTDCAFKRDWAIAGADAFILVYSLMDEKSFQTVRTLRDTLCDIKRSDDIPVVVVGSMVDLCGKELYTWRVVSHLTSCIDWDYRHFELSATHTSKVIEIFQSALNKADIEFPLAAILEKKNPLRLSFKYLSFRRK